MPDDKRGREKQARNADRRQQERAIAADLERMDEPEPPIDETELAFFETALEEMTFPVTGGDVVSSMGHRKLEGAETAYSVAELLPASESVFFDSPEAVRRQVQRPTVARAMKRVAEAASSRDGVSLSGSRRKDYERAFTELERIDAVDAEEATQVLADWIIEQVRKTGTLPNSAGVKRRAAEYCRDRGYEVGEDEWLAVEA